MGGEYTLPAALPRRTMAPAPVPRSGRPKIPPQVLPHMPNPLTSLPHRPILPKLLSVADQLHPVSPAASAALATPATPATPANTEVPLFRPPAALAAPAPMAPMAPTAPIVPTAPRARSAPLAAGPGSRRSRRSVALVFGMAGLAAVLALAAPAAGGAAPPRAAAGPAADLPDLAAPDLALRAMLLILADRRSYESMTVLTALRGGPALRADLATALGRSLDPEGRAVLESLLIDAAPEVRRAAAFALGLLGDTAARPALLVAVRDPDRETGGLAVEALGRLATPVLQVGEQLLALPEAERWPRLLPYLFRFKDDAVVALAEHGLGLADPELHAQAAYALAREPQPAALPLLRRLLGDADPRVRAWAARGLGRAGAAGDLTALAPLLGDGAAGAVIEALRAGAALAAKLPGATGAAALDRGLGHGGTGGAAAGAAAVTTGAASRAVVVADRDSVAASTAGNVPSASAAAADPSLATLAGGEGESGSWRARLLPLLSDPRAGVRVSAIEAAGFWLPDAGLGAALAARAAATAAPLEERALALVALARGERAVHTVAAGGFPAPAASGASPSAPAAPGASASAPGAPGASPAPRAAPGASPSAPAAAGVSQAAPAAPGVSQAIPPDLAMLLAAAAVAPQPRLRASAAQAAALLGDGALLGRLAVDPSPLVREAALTAALAGPGAARAAAAALADRDEGVRITACTWLTDHPVVPLAGLKAALIVALRDESIESPLGAIRAVTARAEAEPLERGALVELLEDLGKQPSHVLRREAALALVRLGRPALPPGPAEGRAGDLPDNLDLYRQIVQRTRRQRTVEVRTSRGSFRLRLDCAQAPRTCLNFLELAGQHFYDGLQFHRVVPDFVVQAGDPRGDGFGGPGYTLRDEINRLRYRRGVVGMALAGADTGGSQFFIALSAQPHLDGGYTAFGEVISGLEVLDAIEAGDRIESIAEIR
jgi:cyclophilin family peptidyl-prolyl cis-trans isomerase